MSELGEQARLLIERSRAAHQPSAANRAHVWWRVERELAAGGGRSVQWRRWFFSAGIAAGLLGVGGSALAWFAATRSSESQVSAPHTRESEKSDKRDKPIKVRRAKPAPSAREVVQVVELEAPSEPMVQPTRQAQARVPTGPQRKATERVSARLSTAPSAAKSSLAEETALIAQAQLATNRGDGAQALAKLERYRRDHESGVLAEESGAARVFALCAMGKRGQAAREAGRFLARWPKSPQTAAIRASCAFADER